MCWWGLGDLLSVRGKNVEGQAGTGACCKSVFPPVQLDLPAPARSVACGKDWSLVSSARGLWAFGNNTCGALGLGSTAPRAAVPKPTAVPFPAALGALSVERAGCGMGHGVAVVRDASGLQRVLSWGLVDDSKLLPIANVGQLGVGHTQGSLDAVEIESLRGCEIVALAVNKQVSMFVVRQGAEQHVAVLLCGDDRFGNCTYDRAVQPALAPRRVDGIPEAEATAVLVGASGHHQFVALQ
eukprot:TRINITY_DN2121_c0_g1_i11.p3 TRINITY_DN2121_c0_g1~~TRINITY_DN2121_c0_g1_i11.p3  ORF type:complete len:240 (-),score=47.78 TRINITY_DN2121_c0_g1_i11:29-748(-)